MYKFLRRNELVKRGLASGKTRRRRMPNDLVLSVEYAPLAYMRGRTLSNAFVILDEAQNTTTEQMFMLLTRIGQNSKCVVTGDVTQIDLPSNKRSGLVEALQALKNVPGIAMTYFSERDVVRHELPSVPAHLGSGSGTLPAGTLKLQRSRG